MFGSMKCHLLYLSEIVHYVTQDVLSKDIYIVRKIYHESL